MTARYASDTSVSVDRSKAEIEKILTRYGATSFMCGNNLSEAVIAFEANDRRIMFRLPLPDKSAREFTHTDTKGIKRDSLDAFRRWEQACRQRWRALALCIKAKLEAVHAGITTFEDEFMAHIVMPDGLTVGQHIAPKIAIAYATKTLPPLLGGPAP